MSGAREEADLFGALAEPGAAPVAGAHGREERTTRVLPSLDWPAGRVALLRALRALCAAAAAEDGMARERLLGEARAAVSALGVVL